MVYDIIITIWILIQILLGYNLILPLILFSFYKIAQLIQHPKVNVQLHNEDDYAIIVTAYEQTELLPSVVSSILNLNYSNFLVYVVADKCDITGLNFNDERIILLRPEKTIANNIGSHFYAIRHFKRNHSRLTIIDSDNLVHPEYITEMNHTFNKGFQAVQGIRKAKNLDTEYACLDAARDIYYHFYDGKVLFGLGSSATLSGSAMAFNTGLYCECLENLDVKGAGFDKVLQYAIVKRGLRIAYTNKAIVYDEKTSESGQLVKQRSRWINTWFKYFGFGFKLIGKGIANTNLNQFLFGLILLRPPLFIFLLCSFICLIVNIWISTFLVIIWVIAFICFVSGFCIALVRPDTDPRILKSFIKIPKFIYFQLKSLLKIHSANKISIATSHKYKKNLNDIAKGENPL